MEHWYISDHHLAHWNILKYGERPFHTLAEMHDALVTYHNELVKPQDHVSFLGDVTIKRGGRLDREWFAKEIRRYNGHKRLYLGNHDHFPVKTYLEAGFEKVYATWRCEEGFVCSHIPLHPRSLSTATANVHGHIHQAPTYEPVVFEEWRQERYEGTIVRPKRTVPYINVSVEVINYRPINKDEILKIIREANESGAQSVSGHTSGPTPDLLEFVQEIAKQEECSDGFYIDHKHAIRCRESQRVLAARRLIEHR